MRLQVQLEYRCFEHESPKAGCKHCEFLRRADAAWGEMLERRAAMMRRIHEKLQKKELAIVGVR